MAYDPRGPVDDTVYRAEVLRLLDSAPGSPGGGTSITQAEVEAAIREAQPITAHSIGAVTTAATGANWVTLPSGTCTAFSLRNRSGTTIEMAIGGTGDVLQILDFEDITLGCLANSNEWSVRRLDQSNTQVTVQFYRYTR